MGFFCGLLMLTLAVGGHTVTGDSKFFRKAEESLIPGSWPVLDEPRFPVEPYFPIGGPVGPVHLPESPSVPFKYPDFLPQGPSGPQQEFGFPPQGPSGPQRPLWGRKPLCFHPQHQVGFPPLGPTGPRHQVGFPPLGPTGLRHQVGFPPQGPTGPRHPQLKGPLHEDNMASQKYPHHGYPSREATKPKHKHYLGRQRGAMVKFPQKPHIAIHRPSLSQKHRN